MNDFNDEKILKNIKDGLDELDQNITVNTPDIARFRKMISQVEYKKVKKAKKEAVIFVLVAAIALSIETFAFNQSILFFIAIQGFAVTSFVIVLLNWLIKTYRKVKSI